MMPRIFLFLLSAVLIAFWGCNAQQETELEIQEEQQQTRQEGKVSAPKAPRVPQTVIIPAGTELEVRLSESLSSAQNQSGDTFESILNKNLEVNGAIAANRGSTVLGKLANVQQSGRTKGRAAMSMRLTEILAGDDSYSIRTETLFFEAESTKKQDAAKIGVGSGIGAVVGAIAGGGKGAAIGAAVGGGAGTATVLATRGRELEFGVEQLLRFTLAEDLEVKLP
jgi:hypothetical protein